MKKITKLLTLVGMSLTASLQGQVFFSEYAEGTQGNNKYIEIANGGSSDVSLDDYMLVSNANAPDAGKAFDFDQTYMIAGITLKSQQVYVIANELADQPILSKADTSFKYVSFNGDDWWAILNVTDSSIVDEIGTSAADPGSGWDVAGVTAGTKDKTLIRKPGIKNGNTWDKSSGTDASTSEWIVLDGPDATTVYGTPGSHIWSLRSMDEDAAEFMDVLKVKTLGKFQVPGNVFDESAAEIPAYDKERNQIFFTDANSDVVHVLDMKDPNKLTLTSTIQLGGSPNSVAVYGDIVAVAVEADPKQDPGKVEFYAADDFKKLGEVTVGALPDMVTFNGDGTKVLTANEGEPSGDYKNDPEGSVSIITVNTSDLSKSSVVTVDFKEYNGKVPSGVRVFGRSAMGEGDAADDTKTTLAQDLEPEYITVNGDKAYVACQENNALAIIDITTAKVLNLLPLGTKDHSLPGNGLDASNKDDGIYISQWPIKGMYMPDAIASFESDGKTYLVTANEGDAREYLYEKDGEEILSFTDEARVKDLNLDPTAFPYADLLQQSDQLGRIKTSLVDGDTDGDGDYDEIYTYGSRSFTIWDASNGAVVWDSKNDFEQLLKQRVPDNFNATNDENNFDNRSDDKGPEPEGVVLGEVNGKMYAFVGLERVGGVVMYDITDPTNPTFASYVNTRDYSGDPEAGTSGNLAPEGLAFIPASESPNGTALLVVTYEVSGTVQVFELGEQEFSSVEELTSAMQARISPNPASGALHVTLKDANVVSIDVMSLDGRIVRHTEANDSHVKVNVNGLNGVYLVNIQDQFGRSTVQKIVIQ